MKENPLASDLPELIAELPKAVGEAAITSGKALQENAKKPLVPKGKLPWVSGDQIRKQREAIRFAKSTAAQTAKATRALSTLAKVAIPVGFAIDFAGDYLDAYNKGETSTWSLYVRPGIINATATGVGVVSGAATTTLLSGATFGVGAVPAAVSGFAIGVGTSKLMKAFLNLALPEEVPKWPR